MKARSNSNNTTSSKTCCRRTGRRPEWKSKPWRREYRGMYLN
nr:hypothetical protein [Prevotella sp.]